MKKTMKTRLFGCLLLLVCLLALGACFGEGGLQTPDETDPPETTEAPHVHAFEEWTVVKARLVKRQAPRSVFAHAAKKKAARLPLWVTPRQ